MVIVIGGHELTEQEVATLRGLFWSQLDHVSATIPAALSSKSKSTNEILLYRRLLFQLIEGIDGIKFPTPTENVASLAKFGDAYLTNVHIGAIITAFSSVLDFCKDVGPTLTDPAEVEKIDIVKEFAERILYSIIPEEVVSAAKA